MEDSGGGGWLLRGGVSNPVSCEKPQRRKQKGEKAFLPQDLFNQKYQEEYAQSPLGKSGSYGRADSACRRSRLLPMPVGLCHVGSKKFRDGSRLAVGQRGMDRWVGDP